MKYIKVPKNFLKDFKFKIEVSPRNDLCCCGYNDCVDVECLMETEGIKKDI